MKSFII